MPLRDHFHPPLSQGRYWESFHGQWAGAIAAALNVGALPEGYFAQMQVSLAGGRVEVDAPTLTNQVNGIGRPGAGGGQATVATLTAPAWAPAAATFEMPAAFPDEMEVLVFGGDGGPRLVGAIELVSPRNKDRPQARRAFAMKCLAYLQQGVGVVVADLVTSRHSNMHDEMAGLLGPDATLFPGSPAIYAAAYRPFRRGNGEERIAVWPSPLEVGQTLPTLPLWLNGVEAAVRLDLEPPYLEACRRDGIA
jgi:hypothetical protein